MTKLVLPFVTLSGFMLIASTAIADPVKLTKAQMDKVVAGTITTTQVNGGGQTPNGSANGVPTVSTNPAGKAPPGQN